ncbi:MAG: PepSY domain-containing protein [Gammaproteobacteria bacterium]
MLCRLSAAALVAAIIGASLAQVAGATGLVTCDSGSPDTWQPQEKLTAALKQKGWDVRRVKVDGGCYEVYALDDKGERVEAYFHPVTFARVPIAGQ